MTHLEFDEIYDEQPTAEQLIKASIELGIIKAEEQPKEEANVTTYKHKTKGTVLTAVRQAPESQSVICLDQEGNEVTIPNRTLARWYEEVAGEPQPVQESLGLQIVEELQQIIDEAEEVEEVPTEQPDEEARYVQLVEPDGTTTTYSYATNTWRQDIEIYPELAHKVPQGTVDNMPWFTPDNQFLGDDMRSSGDCLEEALNIPILANVLEHRAREGIEMTEMAVMDILTEARRLLNLSKTPESQLYEMLHSGGETLQQHTVNQLKRIQEFTDRWMEVKF